MNTTYLYFLRSTHVKNVDNLAETTEHNRTV